jgi:hypothetical protein
MDDKPWLYWVGLYAGYTLYLKTDEEYPREKNFLAIGSASTSPIFL